VTSPAPDVTSRAGQPARGWAWAELPFPVALVALGVFTVLRAGDITVPGSANVLGPQAFPYAVGALLVGTGVAVLVSLAAGHRGVAETGEDVDAGARTDWAAVAKLTGSFLALVVLLDPLGWPIAATLLFAGAAWSLGARPWWRPLLIGAALALIIQVVFTQVLGVYLPAGPGLRRLIFFV
jgi:putative tricarboxylic transport membrane protein